MAKKKTSIGCLFWIALVLLVIVIVLANIKTADKIIKKTGFNEFIDNTINKDKKADKLEETHKQTKIDDNESTSHEKDIISILDERNKEKRNKDELTEEKEKKIPQYIEKNERNMRIGKVFFVKVDDKGIIKLKGFNRSIYYFNSPLKQTILNLLKGPSANEINQEYYTMIPENTELKNIYVKGDIAFLDFNEFFRFNALGKEGLKAQLKQLIYTATEFSNINKVQILIDGEKLNYLGPEGIYIGAPLSRNSISFDNPHV